MMAKARMTVVGDSFVEGRGDPAPDGTYRGWVPRFAEMFGIPGSGCLNLGTFDATTQDVVDRQLRVALVNKAPLIGFVAGVNDLIRDYDAARFRRNLESIFTTLSGPDTVMFTATYADIPRNLPLPASFQELLRGRFAEANEHLREISARTGALCLDVVDSREWADPAMWSADGLHPSPVGHQRFAEAMADLVALATGMVPLPTASPFAGAGAGPLSY
nr:MULTISPECIES: SGNH/GDSL hydrolase family protein [Protofrankia]